MAAIRSFGELQAAGDAIRSSALEWMLDASLPYHAVLCGGRAEAERIVAALLERRDSEFSLETAQILIDGDVPRGGYVALPGEEVKARRVSDIMQIIGRLPKASVPAALSFLEETKSLFAPVSDDCFYLSKIGVVASFRGKGAGRLLMESFIAKGQAAGRARLRLDVAASASAALALYERHGFVVIQRGESAKYGLSYLSMERCA